MANKHKNTSNVDFLLKLRSPLIWAYLFKFNAEYLLNNFPFLWILNALRTKDKNLHTNDIILSFIPTLNYLIVIFFFSFVLENSMNCISWKASNNCFTTLYATIAHILHYATEWMFSLCCVLRLSPREMKHMFGGFSSASKKKNNVQQQWTLTLFWRVFLFNLIIFCVDKP